MKIKWLVPLILGAMTLMACNQSGSSTPVEPQTLTVMTHDSFDISEEVVVAFEAQTNAQVQFLKAGDTGTALNKAILSGDNPLADVFYGVDNTFLSRALEENIFEIYASPLLEVIPDRFKLDPDNRALPVDYGDVCLNYDKQYFEENNLQPPGSLDALTNPVYRGLLVVQNPATSSPAWLLCWLRSAGLGQKATLISGASWSQTTS